MTRLSALCACTTVVMLAAGTANAQDFSSINARYLQFYSVEIFKGWHRSEGAWEKEGEFEQRAVRWLDAGALPLDSRVWMDNAHVNSGDGRSIPDVDLFATRPGAAEEEITQPTDLPKGASLRIKMVQPHQWTLTQHAYWPSHSKIRVYAQPSGMKKPVALGRITFVLHGDVTVKTATGQVIPGITGMYLAAGDEVRTHTGAIAEIFLPSGHIIRMKPGTTLRVPEHADNTAKRVGFVEMVWGKIWASMRNGGSFKIKTPQAVAGVRGTEFTVSHDEVGSAVAVFEGAVDVTADAGNTSLQPGQAATVGNGGAVQTTTVGPEQNWGREGEWSTIIAEQFDTLDESRWEKWGMFGGHAEGVSVADGKLALNDGGGGDFNPCGVTTREKALRWPVSDAMVVELRAQASGLSEHGDLNAGLTTVRPIEADWAHARYPWDTWGPVLKTTRAGSSVWLYMPGREKVLEAEASQIPGGARMIIQRSEKVGEGTVTLTDLQGAVLGTYEGVLGSEFNAGGLWYANVWGYAWPEGEPLSATVDSVWMGPLSHLGEKPVGGAPTVPDEMLQMETGGQ